ncbi:MAG: CocE/NonD family hydrolase [Rhodospirillaceae bacterium]|nr:CocE/NonD family hydrolase [Rhodospirillaceae bacterium]
MTSQRDGRYGALKMRIDDKVMIRMRDGVELACRIYRPDAPGKYPALFAASPYQFETDDLPHSTLFLWREVGPVEWYVSHGYAYVHMDVRGTGHSGGSYNFFDKTEQQDLYEAIEWIAARDWCSGKVGGIGQSYYAWSQWFMGIANPPSLQCIAPYDGAIDIYRGAAYHGGIYCDFMTWWYNLVRGNNLHRAANARIGKRMERDIGWEFISRPLYDEWWKERSAWERIKSIKVPVLSIGHQGKMALHERGNVLAYEYLDAPAKLVLTGARDVFEAHDLFDRIDYHAEWLMPFYDRFLKGADNGYWEKTPDARIYVRGREAWRNEAKWPLPQAQYKPFHLAGGKSGSVTSLNDGRLTEIAPNEDGATAYAYPDPKWTLGNVAMGPQGPDPVARVLTFTSAPLETDLEVVGPIVLELHASSTAADTDFIVKLSDQFPHAEADRAKGLQPKSVYVSRGWLRASHREKDAASTPHRPFHTHANPQPLEPGKAYKFEIELWPVGYCFKAGHRIRLELSNADSPITDSLFTHQYMWYKVGEDTILHGPAHPSRLLLPVVP